MPVGIVNHLKTGDAHLDFVGGARTKNILPATLLSQMCSLNAVGAL